MNFMTILILGFIVANFTPRGQAFLATDAGAAVSVGVAALACLSMLPQLLMGNIISLALVGIWVYFTYPRLGSAQRYLSTIKRKFFPKRP